MSGVRKSKKTLLTAFQQKCETAARAIREGALVEDEPDVSMTSVEAHGLLADMNAAGMLTFDSQSADNGKADERAYVSAVMPETKARLLSKRLNLNSNFVSFVIQPVESGVPRESITVTRQKHATPTGKRNSQKKWDSCTRFPLYMSYGEYAFVLQDATGPRFDEDDILRLRIVECIDPVWGRPAFGAADSLYPTIVGCARRLPRSRS